MLIISFDAVGDGLFERMMGYPTFAALARASAVRRAVSSVFVSNTYPVHTSVATGVVPGRHGLVSNVEPFPLRDPLWNCSEKAITARTLWQAAAKQGIRVAAVLWPVTGCSRSIRYNIPEAHTLWGESQLKASLRSGSKGLQLKCFLRHRALLGGALSGGGAQPGLDNFSTACMVDILRRRKSPGLALIHLIAMDDYCHRFGTESPQLDEACAAMDRNLALLLEAAGDERDVLVFSDHAQLDVHSNLTPNDILVEMGLLLRAGDGYQAGESGCYIECCGGSAFFHAGSLEQSQIDEVRTAVSASTGFRRFLACAELQESGYRHAHFGFCAQPGYSFNAAVEHNKANHGYPLDTPGYDKVFYLHRGVGVEPGSTQGGSLLDIAPLVASRLGIDWESRDSEESEGQS